MKPIQSIPEDQRERYTSTPPQSQSPETDKAIDKCCNIHNFKQDTALEAHISLANHARTLEKRLGEALAEVKTWKEQDSLGNEEIAERGKTILELQQERTSLLARVKELEQDLKDMTWLRDNSNQAYNESRAELTLANAAAKEMIAAMAIMAELLELCRKDLQENDTPKHDELSASFDKIFKSIPQAAKQMERMETVCKNIIDIYEDDIVAFQQAAKALSTTQPAK